MYRQISEHTNTGIALNPIRIHLDGILHSVQENFVRNQREFYSALYVLYNSAKNIIQYGKSGNCSECQVQLPLRVSDTWSLEQMVSAFVEISKVFDSVRNVIQSDVFKYPATAKQFLRLCDEFKENLAYVENILKQDWLQMFHFANLANETLQHGKTLLVRSVCGLGLDAGLWGVDCPIISTSILDLQNPIWYLQDRRDVLLSYHIENVRDFLAMYKTDGYTTVASVEPFSLEVCAYSLLIDDPVDSDTLFMPVACDYSLGYQLRSLARDQCCEIILHSRVYPDAIIITGENPKEKLQSNYLGTQYFSQYYNLPVFALKEHYLERI